MPTRTDVFVNSTHILHQIRIVPGTVIGAGHGWLNHIDTVSAPFGSSSLEGKEDMINNVQWKKIYIIVID